MTSLRPGRLPGFLQARAADFRALGASAPLRAAYELSKRGGSHALVFGSLARLPGRSELPQPRTELDIPPEAAERTRAEAEQICAGTATVFGRAVPVGTDARPTDWNACVDNAGHWPETGWWAIDIRTLARRADVKWTWEVGRQRHLVILARAARLAPERPEFLLALHQGLRSFAAQAAPERGIHWYSNLEIALRLLAWREIASTVPLDADLRDVLGRLAALGRRHLLAELPYTLSTMKNNHLLGDALGLMAMDPDGPAARAGEWLFQAQLERQMHPDGSMIEDSVSYHRFVLEMLARRVLLGSAPENVRAQMVAAAQFLARLGALHGPVPQYGDWDEGRVLVASGDQTQLAGSVRLGLALGGTGAPPDWRAEHDECAWYAPVGQPVAPQPAEVDGRELGGGLARAARGAFTVWLKAGSQRSHGHADLTSVAIALDGKWLIGDAGTGTYNGPYPVRDYFRSSRAHNVLRVAGEEQILPHGSFRWRGTPTGVVGSPQQGEGWTLMWGAHDAYTRLEPPRRLARTVLLRDSRVVVVDWTEGEGGAPAALSLSLAPGVAYEPGEPGDLVQEGRRVRLVAPGRPAEFAGSEDPFDGWWSPTYGAWSPAVRLEMAGLVGNPVLWAAIADGAEPPRTEGGQARDGALSWRVAWNAAGAVLEIDGRRCPPLALPLP